MHNIFFFFFFLLFNPSLTLSRWYVMSSTWKGPRCEEFFRLEFHWIKENAFGFFSIVGEVRSSLIIYILSTHCFVVLF